LQHATLASLLGWGLRPLLIAKLVGDFVVPFNDFCAADLVEIIDDRRLKLDPMAIGSITGCVSRARILAVSAANLADMRVVPPSTKTGAHLVPHFGKTKKKSRRLDEASGFSAR
jgi:hypothetical protein